MTPEFKRNKEFAKWFGEWIAGIQHSRVPVGHIPPEKSASTDEQEYSTGSLVTCSGAQHEQTRSGSDTLLDQCP